MSEAAQTYAAAMPGTHVEEYLAARGISAQASVTSLLGAVIDPLPGHEAYKNMLCIAYGTRAGVVAVKFRPVGDRPSGTKYLWPAGQASHLYNVAALHTHSPYVAICEGELDTVVAHYECGVNAVGIAGVSHWKPHFPRVLKGFRDVFVIADNDDKEDGSNPGQDLAKKILNDIPHARNILLPRGMDVNEFFLAQGKDALPSLLGLLDE